MTTIRIRQRDNSYLYGNAYDSGSAQGQSDANTNMLWERKRINQEKIEVFRENRLQKQIELIEKQQEELKAKLEEDHKREVKRLKRVELLKNKINKYQLMKAQQDQQKREQEK